ncbi:MAG TPA: hypothetical protein VG826_29270 [Pirellulales bacterium]|nr:hypothetical protein [Pirellulales bacterium]
MGEAARPRSAGGQYSALPLRRYKLNATLSAGGSAAAYFCVWDSTSSAYVALDGGGGRATDSFTLYSAFNATGSSGDQGYCAYFPDRQVWEVVASAGGAQIAIGTLSGSLSAGGSVGFAFAVGGTGSDTCYDMLLCSGDSLASGSAVVVAKIANKWYVIQATCPCS